MPRSQAAPAPKPEKQAKDRPVTSTRQFVEADEQKVGQDRPRNLRAHGPAKKALDPTVVQPVERVVSQEKLEALAFMEEMVEVVVHPTTNPLDTPIPEVWNDGKCQRFIRGQRQMVKRKYVEVLARAKKTGYTQERLPNNEGYRNIPSTALLYPFAVTKDSDKGHAWLKSILEEA